MKTISKSIVIFAFMVLLSFAVKAAEIYELKVDGLACPFCAFGIEKQLMKIEGAEEVRVDINTGTVTLQAQEGKNIAESAIKTAVDDSGFSLKGLVKKQEK